MRSVNVFNFVSWHKIFNIIIVYGISDPRIGEYVVCETWDIMIPKQKTKNKTKNKTSLTVMLIMMKDAVYKISELILVLMISTKSGKWRRKYFNVNFRPTWASSKEVNIILVWIWWKKGFWKLSLQRQMQGCSASHANLLVAEGERSGSCSRASQAMLELNLLQVRWTCDWEWILHDHIGPLSVSQR